MGRIVAIDYGRVRTGIAVTDEMQLIASGLTTVATADLISFLKQYVREEKVVKWVVGAPKQMDNTPSESESLIEGFIKKLKSSFPDIDLEREDERFTSKMAVQSMVAGGLSKKQRRNKALIDEISATLILQSYLNRSN
ncbi:Holliday junction resolvase RuvX [Muriicola sp. Z0-33]|uniref:Holliday junction resolvase RuvX n=1 Tax=Muriicola sp. Z0-33 TaxID=2816957 RepID=UPI0022373B3A|nr:Holliday junction resolvase RuvX [Muriicola sp. Z0-33]MCW5515954.1 Holliday junction resolvase RuvX [Muriicola sp. Z0-33]